MIFFPRHHENCGTKNIFERKCCEGFRIHRFNFIHCIFFYLKLVVNVLFYKGIYPCNREKITADKLQIGKAYSESLDTENGDNPCTSSSVTNTKTVRYGLEAKLKAFENAHEQVGKTLANAVLKIVQKTVNPPKAGKKVKLKSSEFSCITEDTVAEFIAGFNLINPIGSFSINLILFISKNKYIRS